MWVLLVFAYFGFDCVGFAIVRGGLWLDFVVWCVVCWWQWFAAGLIGGLYLICRLAVVLVLGCAGVWLGLGLCIYYFGVADCIVLGGLCSLG